MVDLNTPLSTPSVHDPGLSLSNINQLDILNEVTRPLNDIISGFLKGGQDSVVPSLRSGLESLSQNPSNYLNNSNLPNTSMSIGELIDKSREAFILIAQILIAVLETALWILKSILGFVT